MTNRILPMWVIYDHPTDQPDYFVARLWEIGRGPEPEATPTMLASKTLDSLREAFTQQGLVMLSRAKDDDPKIVETWL